jgi:hypothetical protein
MSDVEHARARLKAISEGHYAPKEISVEEAKKQLRAADPSIDISGFLKALHHEENLQEAATSAALETLADPQVVSYWSPVLIGLFQALISAGKSAASPKADKE